MLNVFQSMLLLVHFAVKRASTNELTAADLVIVCQKLHLWPLYLKFNSTVWKNGWVRNKRNFTDDLKRLVNRMKKKCSKE